MKYAGETAYNILENGRGQNSGAIAGVNDYGFSRDIFKLAGYELFDPYYDYTWYQKCSKNDKNPWNVKQGSTKDNVSFLCIGVGRYDKYLNPGNDKSYDPHKAYTAYFMIYQPNKDSDCYLYNGSNFIDYWPFKKKFTDAFSGSNKYNYSLPINGEDVTIQFLVLKTESNTKFSNNEKLKEIDNYYKQKNNRGKYV